MPSAMCRQRQQRLAGLREAGPLLLGQGDPFGVVACLGQQGRHDFVHRGGAACGDNVRGTHRASHRVGVQATGQRQVALIVG